MPPRHDAHTWRRARFGARSLLRALPSLRTLPGLTEDIALQLRSGLVRVEVEKFSAARRAAVTAWVDQVLFAAIGSVGLLVSVVLLVGAGVAAPRPGTSAQVTIGWIGLVLATVMLLRVVAQIVRRQSSAGADDPPGA